MPILICANHSVQFSTSSSMSSLHKTSKITPELIDILENDFSKDWPRTQMVGLVIIELGDFSLVLDLFGSASCYELPKRIANTRQDTSIMGITYRRKLYLEVVILHRQFFNFLRSNSGKLPSSVKLINAGPDWEVSIIFVENIYMKKDFTSVPTFI